MKVKKILCGLLAATLVAASFAGCQDNGGGSTPASTDGSTVQNEKPYDGTTISMLCIGAVWTNTVMDNLDAFKEATGITVEAQQLSNEQVAQKTAVSMAAGGADLDVINYAPIQNLLLYTNNGWLVPLDDYVAKDKEFDIADFPENTIDGSSVDGKLYAIPYFTEREVVTYNKAYFEKAGVKEIPTTMEELEAAAKACNGIEGISGPINGIALRGKGSVAVTQVSSFLYSFGSDFIKDGKAIFNDDAGVQAFEFYGKLAREYGPAGGVSLEWQDTQNLYAQGTVAMRIDCDSQYGFSVDPESSLVADDTSMFVFPKGPAGAKPFNIAAWALGISSGSKNPDAAWEFISWSVGKEMDAKAMAVGCPSARISTWENEEASKAFPKEMVEVINETLPIAIPYDRPVMVNVGDARTEIGNVIITAIEGGDVKAAADKAAANVQKLLDEEAKG